VLLDGLLDMEAQRVVRYVVVVEQSLEDRFVASGLAKSRTFARAPAASIKACAARSIVACSTVTLTHPIGLATRGV
jgi:hypothetical protein